MIPEGWVLSKLEDLALVQRGKFSIRPRNDPRYFGGDMPYVQTGEISAAGTYLTQYSQTLNEKGISVSKVFPANSILITIAANIGDTAITTFEVACPDSVVAIQPYIEKCNYFWLKKALETKKEDLNSKATQNAQKNINLQVLNPLPILTPPLPEQQKIAQILSTWDKAIATIEKLLANAQLQKKALIQQLLTGKKRLKDENGERFSGAWEEVRLSELGQVIGGLTYSPSDVTNENGTLVLRSSNIQNGTLAFHDNVYVTNNLSENLTRQNDILICVRNGSRSLIGKSALIHGKGINSFHGAFMSLFRSKEPHYVYQLLQSDLFFKKVRKNLGATINSINGSDLKKFTFKIPKSSIEREQISKILTNSDLQTKKLELKLYSLKNEKKSLMQQLLTGKRRVKI